MLRLAAEGYTDEEAAARIGITPNKARYLMRIIYLKLGARNRTHAVVIALRRRIIRLSDVPLPSGVSVPPASEKPGR